MKWHKNRAAKQNERNEMIYWSGKHGDYQVL